MSGIGTLRVKANRKSIDSSFKANRKSIDSSKKNGTRDFQNSPPFARSACFYETISGNFEGFQYCNFETDFLENENLFQKTRVTFFS